jgi:putative transposase
MAEENRGWGYRRIQGALSNLKHKLAPSTIAAILERHRIEPAPERNRRTTWKEFLARHWELIVAADFFSAPQRRRSPVGEGPTQVVVGRT